MKRVLLEQLLAGRRARRSAALVTWLDSGRQQLFPADAVGDAPPALAPLLRQALARDAARSECVDGEPVFVLPVHPLLRLFVVGAVHIAQHLAPLAARAGYAVRVIDPRRAFATAARFPDADLCQDWPDRALEAAGLDRRSAVVALTHDPKLDEPALAAALASEAFYVGALGSRRTHAARLERLRARGLADAALARIHGPVGLDIGARGPAEIALSILAELTRCLRLGGP